MKMVVRQHCAAGGDHTRASAESGFSLLQLVITMAIIAVVVCFALVNVSRAREQMRLNGSARVFAGYVEKARLDAIRRHGGGAQPASVQFLDNTRYNVTMDFNGTNTPTTRTVAFDAGVRVQSLPPQALTFDWRGRLALCTQTFLLMNGNGDTSVIDVSGSGDVTVDGDAGDMPAITHAAAPTGDTLPDAVVRGTTAAPAATIGDCSGASGPPPPPINTTGCGGTPSANTSLIQIRKNGGSSGTITITVPSATTVTASAPSNLRVTPASQFVTGSGNFTIVSLNSWRSTFAVTFNAPCFTNPLTVQVKVTN